MAKGKKKKNKIEEKEVITEKSEQNKSKKRVHKKFNIKKNLGRLVALIIVICLLLGIFAYSYEGTKIDLDQEVQETTSTPVSGKVIVVDAGHGVPDEGVRLLH